jgi:hypothetical protein
MPWPPAWEPADGSIGAADCSYGWFELSMLPMWLLAGISSSSMPLVVNIVSFDKAIG